MTTTDRLVLSAATTGDSRRLATLILFLLKPQRNVSLNRISIWVRGEFGSYEQTEPRQLPADAFQITRSAFDSRSSLYGTSTA